MRIEQLYVLAGLFGMSPVELLDLLLRHKAQQTRESKWHLEDKLNKNRD